MIWDKEVYTAPISFLIDRNIREYDISKANINILLYFNLINQKQYQYLYNLPRMERQIRVGIMQRNAKIASALSNGLKQMRNLFCTQNNIQENEILSIRKDALYIIDKVPRYTKFGNVEFLCKNSYSSFYQFSGLEMYYNSKYTILDVKGISDNTLLLHKDFMLDFLVYLFSLIENRDYESAINDLGAFRNDYLNLKLPIGYYRELDNRSMYRTKYKYDGFATYVQNISSSHIEDVDLSYNNMILMELHRILVMLIMEKKP